MKGGVKIICFYIYIKRKVQCHSVFLWLLLAMHFFTRVRPATASTARAIKCYWKVEEMIQPMEENLNHAITATTFLWSLWHTHTPTRKVSLFTII